MKDIAQEISEIYSKIRFQDLPKDVVEITKIFILDSIGTGLAGTRAPGCKQVINVLKKIGGNPESTVIGFDFKLPATASALFNSMAIHALDFDDTYDPAAMHCYTSVLPAAIAVAESKSPITGKELINSVVLGVDLCARLGTAITSPLSWIRTATCGSFASALAACKIMKLSEEKILNALGVVYSQTSGNAQCLIDGGLAKRMQPGFSARSGILSAILSKEGLSGAKEVFEGRYGYFNLYEKGNYNRNIVLDNLGKEYFGLRISIKPYPSCRMTHASIDAAIYLKEKYQLTPKEIKKIEVYTSKMVKDMVGKPFEIRENPQVDAQFSIPYTVAVALTRGKPFIDDFYDDRIRHFENMDLTKKIYVLVDDQLESKEIKSANIKVYLNDGNEFSYKVEVFKGNPQNPLSDSEHIEKFKKCAHFGMKKFKQNQLDELIEKILNLEKIKNISELTRLLS